MPLATSAPTSALHLTSDFSAAMANALHNPTFKRPSIVPPPRLPSPPHAFVEPLSPHKPVPLEPSFNYPAINDHIDFTVRPEGAFDATPRARAYSASHRNTHQRTPSTIDTLAEAALAASPSYPSRTAGSSAANGYYHAHPPPHPHGMSEPPHKRARSELLPSPFIEQYASRPATSYEPNNAWTGQAQPVPAYNSRVEEAALLLNFQSGGWAPTPSARFAVPTAPAARPHANSFPQDAFHVRPAGSTQEAQATLLPPFNPQDSHQLPPALPSPQRTIDENDPSSEHSPETLNESNVVEMADAPAECQMDGTKEQPSQTQTPPDDTSSPAPSLETATSEMPAVPKARRGWPKGKPRGSGAKRTMAEKAATKRAASRRKPADAKAGKSSVGTATGGLPDVSDISRARRKSFSDTVLSGEEMHVSTDLPLRARAQSVPLDTQMVIREASPSKAVRRKAAVTADTICAGCETSREATRSHGELDEWISCNGCKKWFHTDCAGFKKAHEIRDVDKFFCSVCEPEHGKTTLVRKSTRAHASVDYAELQRGVLKTSEESVEHHYIQPIKDGTFTFDEEAFPRMRPEMVTREFLERSGTFVEPICIPAEWNPRPWERDTDDSILHPEEALSVSGNGEMTDLPPDEFEYEAVADLGQDRLGMVIPQGLTVRQVCNLVGPDWPIDVIDVKTQNSGAKWNLSRWADYYEEIADEKAIRNVISLEVSQTKLGRLLQRPKVVRDIDLQDDVWPQEESDKGKFPKVQFYCLMSVADSYTDFHIDFGGSSVYYHILKGKKTFFFIPPKSKHLKAYEEWNDSPQQNYTFLPSITNECYRVDLNEGDTMLIPSGWIHAVWTPADSLVIGGNFLNRLSYKNQFKVVEIEKVNETPMKFRYPYFQKIMWYTAIKYLKDDPLPAAVSQLFNEGKRFEREVPIWADFDGEMCCDDDTSSGAQNARFYSQAEVEGLPDLVNFIFRTVMLVMGRVEGVSADRMKRVNASIPKGNGEPLDVAKTFAIWVAWKRGNEDPPAWAHPDAVLPSSKEHGAQKKLSERKLKELERKEAIAAWRIAPDRQSARVMTKIAKEGGATADASTIVAPKDDVHSSPASMLVQAGQPSTPYYQYQPYAAPQSSSAAPPPANFVMPNFPGQHLSTPKTSVLGPKRVACDACRKRRIRCKHKDVVLQVTPTHPAPPDGANVSVTSQPTPDMHDNITVTPTKHLPFMNTVMDGQSTAVYSQGPADGAALTNGVHQINRQHRQPASNTNGNANIPLTMDGVPIFADAPKRGRSKACYECRKSKRRCIHDESGNVDPVKASETPVPRGPNPIKKRSFAGEGSPILVSKSRKPSEQQESPRLTSQTPVMQGHGVLKPQTMSYKTPKKSQPPTQLPHSLPLLHQQSSQDDDPPIDPSLFSMYTDSKSHEAYGDGDFSFSAAEPPPVYTAPSHPYQIPSLEQIANEVLVDLNGNEYPDHGYSGGSGYNPTANGHAITHLTNGTSKTDESVDSAVSLPSTEGSEQRAAAPAATDDQRRPGSREDIESRLANAWAVSGMGNAYPSVETNGQTSTNEINTSPTRPKSSAGDLPLYQPPAALSKSPEMSVKHQVPRPNGVNHASSSCPPLEAAAASGKRKRESTSATPATSLSKGAKKAKIDGSLEEQSNAGIDEFNVPLTEEEKQSLELARALQQEDLGLRRRSK